MSHTMDEFPDPRGRLGDEQAEATFGEEEALQEDGDELNNSNLSFPSAAHPKMSPCSTCGKMFFPWSLKQHIKRCGKEPNETHSNETKEADDEAFESLSEDSLKFKQREMRHAGRGNEAANRRDHPSESLEVSREVGSGNRSSAEVASFTGSSRAQKPMSFTINLNPISRSPANASELRVDPYGRPQMRQSPSSGGNSNPERRSLSSHQRPFSGHPHQTGNHEDSYFEEAYGFKKDDKNSDEYQNGRPGDSHPQMRPRRGQDEYYPSSGRVRNAGEPDPRYNNHYEHDEARYQRMGAAFDEDIGSTRSSVSSRPASTRTEMNSYPIANRSSSRSIASSSSTISSRQPQRTPPRASPMTRRVQPQTPQTPQSLSEKAREDRERAERVRLEREEQLVLERARVQKELDRINDELRMLRAGRGKSEQTITPMRKSPEPRRPAATAPSRFNSRFDDRSRTFNPRSIDPSNATSPDNPLATSIYQVMPHPPISRRGGGSQFIV